MRKREPIIRTIYNNYDLWSNYNEAAKEICIENNILNPTDDDIWEEIYFQDNINWDGEKERLIDFFDGSTWILQGYSGRWDGVHRGGYIFTDFMEMFEKATKDCEYIHIYDENGLMYLKCSHHDGTNLYMIKKITDKGIDYLERWEENWGDKRTEEYIHDQIMKHYSVLPHFAHQIYGCPKTEYEKNCCKAK